MKLDIPAIPFARAWEAILTAAGNDSGRITTYRAISLEYFEDKGIRLISSDGYLSARAWVPLDETDDDPEPAIDLEPTEQFIIVDADRRGLSLLKHARKLLKATWQLKAKEEQPDTSPKLQIEVRTSSNRLQGVLEGMDMPLFYIDFPDHEIVALSILQSEFVDWRPWTVGKDAAIESLKVGLDQLIRITAMARLYPTYAAEWAFHGDADTVGVKIGPIRCVMKTAEAIDQAKAQAEYDEAQERLLEDEAAYDETGDDSDDPEDFDDVSDFESESV